MSGRTTNSNQKLFTDFMIDGGSTVRMARVAM
jgi:hypothetical protein